MVRRVSFVGWWVVCLACGGLGGSVEAELAAQGITAEVVEEDPAGGFRWVGSRADQFCTGHADLGAGVGPVRTAPTLSREQCDPRGGPRERAWTCEHRDDPFACRDGGLLLQRAGDPAALPLFERACSLGEGAGCRFAGVTHRTGQLGAARDDEAAADWFERGCNLSDDRACLQRGLLLATDPEHLGCGTKAVEWYRRGGPESKDAWARQLAQCPDGDPVKARALWLEACKTGSLQACRSYGYALVDGIGGPVDLPAAIDHFRRGCRNEPPDLEACVEFGLALVASRDPSGGPRALAAFQQVCDAGIAVGCRNVGVMLRDGQLGVVGDGAGARFAFQKACDGGDAPSCDEPGVVAP
jgi:TPR repeat protein